MMPTLSGLLIEFEKRIGESNLSVKQFATEYSEELDKKTLLALIGVSTEYQLRKGMFSESRKYINDFPFLTEHEVQQVIATSIGNFVESYCPISDLVGQLPVEYGGYRFLRELGRGGTGVVYEAEQLSLKRTVAVKVVLLIPDASNLISEATILGRLEHPNILTIYDHGKIEHLSYISMQLIHGRTLKYYCRKPPNLSPERAVTLIIQILDAIGECHGRGIVHWDLKPSNILVAEGKPIVADFGLAKHLGSKRKFFAGSPQYMAPEIHSEDETLSPTLCDVFSLGVILYELLTGNRPYANAIDSFKQPPRRPRDYRVEIDEELEQICLKAISVSPSYRFQTTQNFRDSLLAWKNQSTLPQKTVRRSSQSPGSTNVNSKLAASTRRNQRVMFYTFLLVTLTLLATIAGLVIPFFQSARWDGDSLHGEFLPKISINVFRENTDDQTIAPVGTVGDFEFSIYRDDYVSLVAELPTKAICYLVAANPDGSLQFLTESESKTEKLMFPEQEGLFFKLNDGAGQQAFLLLVAKKRIKLWKNWRSRPPDETGWDGSQPLAGVWVLSNNQMKCIRGPATERGTIELKSQTTPLQELAVWFESNCECSAHMIAFPVRE